MSAICLISALAYHEITTQVPHEVYVALERGTEAPRLTHPPIRVFWFSGQAFTLGIQTHKIDGVPVRIYSPEKTIADCFKCGTAGSGRCLQTNLEGDGTMAIQVTELLRLCPMLITYVPSILGSSWIREQTLDDANRPGSGEGFPEEITKDRRRRDERG